MTESKTDVLLLMLIGVVILLMAAIIGLFLRMNQLQRTVLRTLASSPAVASAERGLEIGTEAPDFALPDTNGATVSLNDFAGGAVGGSTIVAGIVLVILKFAVKINSALSC
jgi:hypothetical protein